MNTNKRLIFITTRLFWPTDSGRKVSLYHYCRGLHEVYGYDIYIYSFLEFGQMSIIDDKPNFIKEIRFAKEISKYEKLKNLCYRSLFSKKQWPLQCSLFFSRENCIAIRDYCKEIIPDIVITDMIRTAPYLETFADLSCKKILDMDDLLSKRYQRQIYSENDSANIAGQYSEKMSGILNRMISIRAIRKLVLKMESKRLNKAEVEYARKYDSTIFVSEFETNELNQKLGENKAVTITMGIDYTYYAEKTETYVKPNSLSFVGNFRVAANVDTLDMIVTNILPLIRNNYKLYVIGPCTEEIRKKYSYNKYIIFTSKVDDIRKYVKATQVFLAPIAYGSGIKTKILEAMAMGMPVITNSVGMEGIQALNGVHLICSDNYEELAAYVDELFENRGKADQIGKAAQEYVYDHYRWDNIYKSFEKIGLKRAI